MDEYSIKVNPFSLISKTPRSVIIFLTHFCPEIFKLHFLTIFGFPYIFKWGIITTNSLLLYFAAAIISNLFPGLGIIDFPHSQLDKSPYGVTWHPSVNICWKCPPLTAAHESDDYHTAAFFLNPILLKSSSIYPDH